MPHIYHIVVAIAVEVPENRMRGVEAIGEARGVPHRDPFATFPPPEMRPVVDPALANHGDVRETAGKIEDLGVSRHGGSGHPGVRSATVR